MGYRTLYHVEWIILLGGITALALMNPYVSNGTSLCLLEFLNFPFCPGEGLGHSISLTFRGDLLKAFESHPVGPFALIILVSRIIYLWRNFFINLNNNGDL